MTEKELLVAYRKEANENLPKLKKLLVDSQDEDLKWFVQKAIDSYILNVCELARAP